MTNISKSRRIAGNILLTLGGLMLLGSAVAKLLHAPGVVQGMAAFGIDGPKLMVVGTEELIGALLYLIPRTRSLGFLLITAHMGGAIATHIEHSNFSPVPSVFLAFLWMGAFVRHPQILWSFCWKNLHNKCLTADSVSGEAINA